MSYDTIIVGGGLFGQIIAKNLIRLGHGVMIIDDRQPMAGSKPAACLMKPSWYSGLGKEVHEPALKLLSELYTLREVDFELHPSGVHTKVYWIDPKEILSLTTHKARVLGFHQEVGGYTVPLSDGRTLWAKNLVLAAGVWTDKLIDVPGLTGRAGAAFEYQGTQVAQPFINAWAPYRQLVGFNRGEDHVWVGDGTAIKPDNWTEKREHISTNRCDGALQKYGQCSQPEHRKTLFGIRPYVPKAKPCYLKQEATGLWVATGGAKNGTIAAGYCAHVIGEALA